MWLLLACSSPTVPYPDIPYPDILTYDKSCTQASDCQAELISNCDCSCDSVALSKAGAAAFEADVSKYWAAQSEGCMLGCNPYCPDLQVDCVNLVCTLQELPDTG